MAYSEQYIVVSKSCKASLCTLKLHDGVNETTVKIWDLKEPPNVGAIIYIDGGILGEKVFADRIRLIQTEVEKGHPLYKYVPHATEREEWDRCIEALIAQCTDDQLIPLIREYADKLYGPYAKYPAATSVHHAFPGGLLVHTYQMLHMLEGLYPCLPYEGVKLERCVLAILFHDYGKLYEYDYNGNTQQPMYLLGHIFISSNRLREQLLAHDIPDEEIDRIVHIVLAHHGQLEYGSPIMPATQEAIIVNHLDNLSAKTDCIYWASNGERVFALGTNAVK